MPSSTGTPENTYLFDTGTKTVEDRDGSEDEEAICVKKYEGLKLKNDRRRLNIKLTRNLGNGTLYILIKGVERRP